MGKLRVLSGKEVCVILAQHGFIEVRRRGSHIVMQKKLSEGTITVPVLITVKSELALYFLSLDNPAFPAQNLKHKKVFFHLLLNPHAISPINTRKPIRKRYGIGADEPPDALTSCIS